MVVILVLELSSKSINLVFTLNLIVYKLDNQTTTMSKSESNADASTQTDPDDEPDDWLVLYATMLKKTVATNKQQQGQENLQHGVCR